MRTDELVQDAVTAAAHLVHYPKFPALYAAEELCTGKKLNDRVQVEAGNAPAWLTSNLCQDCMSRRRSAALQPLSEEA